MPVIVLLHGEIWTIGKAELINDQLVVTVKQDLINEELKAIFECSPPVSYRIDDGVVIAYLPI